MRSMPGASGARIVSSDVTLLDDKIEDVTRYIHTHTHSQQSEVDGAALSLSAQDAANRIVTIMHPSSYTNNICRGVSLAGDGVLGESGVGWSVDMGEQLMSAELTEEDGWLAAALVAVHLANAKQPGVSLADDGVLGESGVGWSVDVGEQLMSAELTEEDGRLAAALVAVHLANAKQPSLLHQHHIDSLPKVRQGVEHSAVEHTVLMDAPMRLFNNQSMDDHQMLSDTEHHALELSGSSPAQSKQSRKSLPHKKRISRKLRRPQPGQDVVLLDCAEDVQQEEILPDNFVVESQQPERHHHHIEHEAHLVRAILICQICGDFYGEDQLKFFHHLKQHYEPHGATIIIENPVGQMHANNHLAIDKMNTCIVDSAAPLPEALVELSLENTVPNKMSLYHNTEKHILYTSGDKTLSYISNKCTYSTAIMDKEMYEQEVEKEMYEGADKEVYSCTRCNKSFRKQKLCEAHIKEAHSAKVDEMSEFSEPEDLMEGIHVLVEAGEGGEAAEGGAGGFLTVDNGHVHQDHMKHWYIRNVMTEELDPGGEVAGAGPGGGGECTDELAGRELMHDCPLHLKEEVLQRILESEVDSPDARLPVDMMLESGRLEDASEAQHETPPPHKTEPIEQQHVTKETGEKKVRIFECQECSRVFKHRNSLLYHILSHNGTRPHKCIDCDKGFYTAGALKVHARVHSGDKPYKCSECEREFRQWGDLKYHMVSLHSTKKHYKCDYCSKEFARKYSLNIHIKIHTGERNYKCEYCNKTFRASSYRLVHMRTHTGEKPFGCEECGKQFRVAGDLRRHMVTHSRVRLRKHEPVKLVNIKIQESAPPNILRASKRPRNKFTDQQILPDRSPERSAADAEMEFLNRGAKQRSPPRNITPFQHLQKKDTTHGLHISDVRSYASRPETHQDAAENVFLERLTDYASLYNVAPIT